MLDKHELQNIIYSVVCPITEGREHNGSYKGGHHLAQEIAEVVAEAIVKTPLKSVGKKAYWISCECRAGNIVVTNGFFIATEYKLETEEAVKDIIAALTIKIQEKNKQILIDSVIPISINCLS
jgi:hypothetical protein